MVTLSNTTFHCANGGTVKITSQTAALGSVGTQGGWAYYDDLYIDAADPLELGIQGEHDVTASLATEVGSEVLTVDLQSTVDDGTADIRVMNLQPHTWYELKFNETRATTANGYANVRSTATGTVEFTGVNVPDE